MTSRPAARMRVTMATVGPLAVAVMLGSPVPQIAALSDPRADVVIGAVTLLCAMTVTWSLLVWAALVLVALGMAALPGAAGSAGKRVLMSITPAALRATLTATVGLSLTVGLAACGGTAAAQSWSAPQAPVAAAAGAVDLAIDLDWPMSSAVEESGNGTRAGGPPSSASTEPGTSTAVSTDAVPTAAGADEVTPTPTTVVPDAADTATGVTDTAAPAPAPAPAPAAAEALPASAGADTAAPDDAAPTASDDSYRVQAGDSLWSIAKAHLPSGAADAQIDALWRAWYATNQDVIGPNPGLIVPGQILHAPAHH